MNELADRAEKLWLAIRDESDYDATVAAIGQALLAERRLAMEEAAKMVEDSSCKDHGADCMLPARKKRNEIAAKLRAAAEKEVSK